MGEYGRRISAGEKRNHAARHEASKRGRDRKAENLVADPIGSDQQDSHGPVRHHLIGPASILSGTALTNSPRIGRSTPVATKDFKAVWSAHRRSRKRRRLRRAPVPCRLVAFRVSPERAFHVAERDHEPGPTIEETHLEAKVFEESPDRVDQRLAHARRPWIESVRAEGRVAAHLAVDLVEVLERELP